MLLHQGDLNKTMTTKGDTKYETEDGEGLVGYLLGYMTRG